MKKIILICAILASLTGCVVTDPYYVQTSPVYVQPRPVYVQPQCRWAQQWDPRYRVYRSVKVCR
jgi:hypothetical protein